MPYVLNTSSLNTIALGIKFPIQLFAGHSQTTANTLCSIVRIGDETYLQNVTVCNCRSLQMVVINGSTSALGHISHSHVPAYPVPPLWEI